MAQWVRLALLVLSAALAAGAADLSKLKPEGYVNDFAGVIDASSAAQAERYLGELEQATGAQVAVVTIDTLDGEPIDQVANSLFRKWGIGAKGKNEGVLLLLAVKDRKSRIEVGYGLEPILPDGFAGSVLREMRPALRENNFGQAVLAGTAHIGQTIAEKKGVTLGGGLVRRAAPRSETGNGIPWPLIIIGIMVLMGLLGRGGGGFLGWMLLGNVLGSGTRHRDDRWRGGGWGGGGFGGSDSGGGGFGGFGGGDSGGGGASSDW